MMSRLIFSVLLIGLTLTAAPVALAVDETVIPATTADGQQVPVLDSVQVIQTDLPVTVSAASTLAPAQQVNVVFETAGLVTDVYVIAGQFVRLGEALAKVDPSESESALRNAQLNLAEARAAYAALIAPPRDIDVRVAQAAVNVAQAAINNAINGRAGGAPTTQDIEIARLQVELAKNALWQAQLNRGLTDPGNTGMWPSYPDSNTIAGLNSSDSEIDIAQSSYQATVNRDPNQGGIAAANAQLIRAQNELDQLVQGPNAERRLRAELDVQAAELAVQQAEAQLAKTVLVAPFDGVVSSVGLKVGQFPLREQSVVLIDTRAYQTDLPVDETDIARVVLGQPVQLTVDAITGLTLSGSVTQIAAVPTIAANSQRVSYAVRVVLDATESPIRPGMRTTGNIIVDQLTEVVIIPNRFLLTDAITQENFVLVPIDDGFQRVVVTIGVRTRESTQIISGLQAGQTVVLLPDEIVNPPAAGGFEIGF